MNKLLFEAMMPKAKNLLQGLFVTFILISILFSYKLVKVHWLIFPIGVVTIALSFIINCVYTDLYGKKESLKLIIISAICQMSTTIVAFLLCYIPSSNDSYNHYLFVFGRSPLSAFADAICLSLAYSINSYIIERTQTWGNKMFPIRSIIATVSGEIAYNFIWVFIAMIGEVSIEKKIIMAISMILVKLIFATVFSIPGVVVLFLLKRKQLVNSKTIMLDFLQS